MSEFSQKTGFHLATVVASNPLNLTRNISVKTGITDIKFGQVCVIKTTGLEPWDGTATDKLAIAIKAQRVNQSSVPCLVTGGYISNMVVVGDAPINAAQKLALMASILFDGQ